MVPGMKNNFPGSLRFTLTHRWPWLFVMVGLSFGAAVAGLAAPFFQKVFVDRLTHTAPDVLYGATSMADVERALASWHPVWILATAFVAMNVAQWLGTLGGWIGVREALKRQEVSGEAVYRKALSLRQDQTLGLTVGEVVALYATDIRGATVLVDQTIPAGAGVLFPFVCAPLAVKMICGIPIGVTVAVMATVLTVSIALSIRQSRYFQNFKALAAERTGLVNEWIQNIRLLRILGWVESFEKKIFAKREEETANRIQMVTNGQAIGAFGSSINFLMNLVAVVALTSVKGEGATPGDYFALLWIFGVFLSRPFRQVPWIFTFTFDGLTSIDRIERFMRRHPESMANESSAESPKRAGLHTKAHALRVRGMSLMVPNADGTPGPHALLKKVTFDLRAGEFTAIVGEVGSGKSLLLMSLLGETAATADEIKIGEVDWAFRPREERRVNFSFVPQDGFVMSSTLRENVAFRYDMGTESDAGILRALQQAQFDPTSEGVADGLATEIGERGVNLSGGQKQRIGLARAAFIQRPIVLLDDALSAVDVDTERKLFDTLLFGEWKNATRLMVTHRLSVLDRVDRVLFMQDGAIVDQGSFAELVERSAAFQAFVSSMGTEGESPKPIAAVEPTENTVGSVPTTASPADTRREPQ